MVFIAPLIGAAALLSHFAVAMPQPRDLSRRTSGYESESNKNYGSSYDSSKGSYDSSKDSSYGSSGYGSSKDSSYGSSGYDSSKDNSYGSSGYGSSEDKYGSDDGGSNYESSKNSYTTSSEDSKSYNTNTYEDSYNTYTTTSTSEYSTSTELSTSTSSAENSYTTSISYGSGSSDWSEYDDCVQQCIASFAPSSAAYYAPTDVNSGSDGGSGTGATHTVIVAPSQGVLRYFPFATNASVGDTIKFMWGANNHTVTKGSALLPCNKSGDALFASGTHDKDFVFTQVVNTTEPTFYYCATPGHCQKGMFGVINPPANLNAPTSASGMMQSLSASNPDLKMYAALTDKATAGTPAAIWGGAIDMAAMPDWAHSIAAENILYTRNVLATNPELVKADGSIDLSTIGSTPLMVPQDIAAALANAGSSTSSTSPTNSVAGAVGATESDAPSKPPSNGAGALASPRVFVALMVVVATIFVL
jgi:plastocyanin